MLNHKSQLLISVVIPVYNGAVTLDRALRSVVAQTFRDWELVAVDDASSDESASILKRWTAEDGRIRLLRLDENRGVSAARNAAIQNARGRFVTYLDQDDEYYPDYLSNVARLGDKADVLMFAYDFVYEDGPAGDRPPSWDPGLVRQLLFAEAIATPLGVAHRRELWQKVGGFNEAWCEEDSDFWRRMARVGAAFVFLPLKSGRYHVRADSASRMPHITRRQREMFLENWRNGRPIYEKRDCKLQIENCKLQIGEGSKVRKIAFVSPHCLLDFTNGAATATLDGLALLARSGFECQAFCNSRMDAWEEVLVEEILAKRGLRYVVRNAQIGAFRGRMIFTSYEKIPVTLFNSASTRGGWVNAEEIAAFLTACEIFLTKNRPDVVWTYGGDPVSLAVQKLVKRLDIPILFGLHNFAYRDAAAFQTADYVIVPTEFCRQHYWNTLGLASLKLPLVMDAERVRVTKSEISNLKSEISNKKEIHKGKTPNGPHPLPLAIDAETARATKSEISNLKSEISNKKEIHKGKISNDSQPSLLPEGERAKYVTFVNPEPRKGVHVFARIAEVLACRRPDIPVLIGEGAARTDVLAQLGIDFGGLKNVTTMPNTPDPRQFYAVTKLLLMPSLMENAGFVAMEAMLNGIPVLASNRGGLPETIGDAGTTIDIPARYTPETRDLPTAEEVELWIQTIIRLWDDAAEYERWSRAARGRAEQWHPDRLAPIYREFFGSITHQPGPPLVRTFTKIFGLGLSRTGTSSLAAALMGLRIKSIHYPTDARTYWQIVRGDSDLRVVHEYDALLDITPVPFYKELDRIWPGSKFIYTVRSSATWLRSLQAHWDRGGRPICENARDVLPLGRLLLQRIFGQLDWDAEKFLAAYQRHDRDVREYFKERPRDLLIMDVCDKREGWDVLCPFLGCAVQDRAFPHLSPRAKAGEAATAGFCPLDYQYPPA